MRKKPPTPFISNENVSDQLFHHKFLDHFTRTHIAVPVAMFFLYAVGLIWWTKAATLLSNLQITGLFLSGALFFTLSEYLMHRYVYHLEPRTEARKKMQWKMHGVHHEYPKDKQRLEMPPVLSVLIGTILLGLFRLILGDYAFSFLAGFMIGYALYLVVPYSIHIFIMPNNFFKALWVNHAIHHYSEDEIMFGVSSPLWDYIFSTLPGKAKKRAVQINVTESNAERWL